MNAVSPIPRKIPKMVPLLGSNQDGDVVVTARAMGRTLHAAGLDFHSLAAAINTGPAEGEGLQTYVYNGAAPPYRPSPHRPQTFTEKQQAHHQDIAKWCRDHDAGRLTEWERNFVADLAAYRREPTIRQADRLDQIADKLDWMERGL